MINLTTNTKPENFDIKDQFQNLLIYSQEIIKKYDALVHQLQGLPFDSYEQKDADLALSQVFDLIVGAYYLDIRKRKNSINIITDSFAKFNEVYNIENQIYKYHLREKELVKECKNIIKHYNIKVK